MDKDDFNMFWKISSAYHAATFSAVSPIVFPSEIPSRRFGRQFYDTFDDEDKMPEKMRERIELGSRDIEFHLQLHQLMCNEFYSIDEAINSKNRQKIAEHSANLLGVFTKYSKLVRTHKSRLEREAFLEYPTCIPGHLFMVCGYNKIRENRFNPKGTSNGMKREIEKSARIIESFSTGYEVIPEMKLTGTDMGEGISDGSLRGNIDLTKELLKRADYVLHED